MSAFFHELYAVARHTPLSLLITPAGERLSVIVQPKPTGDAADNPGFAKPILAIGTPAELDAELPAKIREYADKVNDVRTSISLPIEAVDAERDKKAKKTAASTKRQDKKAAAKTAKETAAATRKAAREKRSAEAAAKKQAAKDKRATKKKPATPAAAGKIKLPGKSTAKPAPKPAAKARTPAKPSAPASPAARKLGPRSALPGKPECIADYKTLVARFGKELTRRGFVKQAPTKRRYEKLWDSWEAFIAEAMQLELPLGTEQPSGTSVTSAVAVSRTAVNPAEAWPFPPEKNSKAQAGDGAKAESPAAAASAVPPPVAAEPMCVVMDRAGNVLLKSTKHYADGEQVVIVGQPAGLAVACSRKDDAGTLSCTVDAWPVFDLEWKPLGFWTYERPEVGAVIKLANQEFRIVEIEAWEVMVSPVRQRIKDPATSAEPSTAAQEQ